MIQYKTNVLFSIGMSETPGRHDNKAQEAQVVETEEIIEIVFAASQAYYPTREPLLRRLCGSHLIIVRLQLRQYGGRMGFLSKLFGIPSFGGATNALLVELTLPKLTASQRAELKAQYFEIERRSGFPNVTDEAVLVSLNRSTRVAQLNCLALAMDELGYQPPLKNEFWHKVRNPFEGGIYFAPSSWIP